MFYLNKGLNCFCLFFDFMGFYFHNGIKRQNDKEHTIYFHVLFKALKLFQLLVLFGFFRFETSFDSNVRFTQTGLVTWNCFVECRVFRCFRCVNFLSSRINRGILWMIHIQRYFESCTDEAV